MAIFSTTISKASNCDTVTLTDTFTSGAFKLTGFSAVSAELNVYSHLALTTITTYDVIDDTIAGAYGTLTISGDDLIVTTSAFADGIWFFEFEYTYTDVTLKTETVCICINIDCDMQQDIVQNINTRSLTTATNCDTCDDDSSLPIKYPMMHHALEIAVECQLCEKAIDIFDYLTYKVDSNQDCLGC